MQILERSKDEVISKAETMSDFLKMEYLEKCSERFSDSLILQYCYSELVRLYQGRVMYSDALKYLAKLQSLTISPKEKLHLYEKEIELFIKSGQYDHVIGSYKEAIKLTNELGELELRRKVIQFFKDEAIKLERSKKYAALTKLYERLIIWLTDMEKNEFKKKLFEIYKKLGKVRESIELEKKIHW
ncbi:hypothetical protein J4221_04985 [Candidatus Pacearchaeota archaeon]|nr:hypothetical protein [Candidatus Pacearchaeota archaeon]